VADTDINYGVANKSCAKTGAPKEGYHAGLGLRMRKGEKKERKSRGRKVL